MEETKKKILITAFEPFDDKINITEDIIKKIGYDTNICEIKFVILPVTDDKTREINEFFNATNEFQPDFIISLGESNITSENPSIAFEESVYESDDSKNCFYSFNKIEVLNIFQKYCKDNKIEFEISQNDDDGSCNAIHYSAALYMSNRGGDYKDNFIFLHFYDFLSPNLIDEIGLETLDNNKEYKTLLIKYSDLYRIYTEQTELEQNNQDLYADELPIIANKCLDDDLKQQYFLCLAETEIIEEEAYQNASVKAKKDNDYENMINIYANAVDAMLPLVLDSIKDEKPENYFIPTPINLENKTSNSRQ
ncbi:MAG: hypothetical protein SFT90_02475 [Rickettsiales bacterium]|nr:hypothetical protein [Rickettsiales bacterium]